MAFLDRDDIAIDLGTANTIAYNGAGEIIFNEPTCLAMEGEYELNLVAIGEQAKRMRGRTHKNLTIIHPLVNGVVSDFENTQILLQEIIKINKKGLAPRVGISVPQNLTQVERHSLHQAAASAGAKEVLLIEDPFSASVGYGADISQARARMVIDAGAGLSEVSVISLNGLVTSAYSQNAGDFVDRLIIEYYRHNKNLSISRDIAESIKKKVNLIEPNKTMQIGCKDLVSGIPTLYEVDLEEIKPLVLRCFAHIKEAVIEAVHNTPLEMASDLMEDGAILTGGMALIPGAAEHLSKEINMKVVCSSDPLGDVARGIYKIMTNYDKYTDWGIK